MSQNRAGNKFAGDQPQSGGFLKIKLDQVYFRGCFYLFLAPGGGSNPAGSYSYFIPNKTW